MAKYKMTGVFPEGQPAHWNNSVPYPRTMRWGMRPVPNAQSVGPIGMSQFASEYNPWEEGSVQPYMYPDHPRDMAFSYFTSNPEALTPGGVTIQRPFDTALAGVYANPCARGNCGAYGEGEGFLDTPIVGTFTVKCALKLTAAAAVGWVARGLWQRRR